ncbi:diguanylate cyclase domain-containing protein [Streptomyces olivaceus]|uniref:diguanylate cyclase domain-containing protein n=1 Tax=Streptomyces olivaceus TaxID=47716 RepID=UPI0036F5832B
MSTPLVILLAAGTGLVWGVHAWWMSRRLSSARRDPLTGLWTREAFTRRARRLLRNPHAIVALADVDEFAAVLIDPDGTAADRFAVLARVLARPVDTAPDVHTTVSLGWVRRADHPTEDLSGLLRRADEAMYAAKRGSARVRRAALGRLLATVAGRRAGRRGAA